MKKLIIAALFAVGFLLAVPATSQARSSFGISIGLPVHFGHHHYGYRPRYYSSCYEPYYGGRHYYGPRYYSGRRYYSYPRRSYYRSAYHSPRYYRY